LNGKRSILSIRLLLFGEAVVFLIAAFVHTGLWIDGYRHREARIAESVLAGALYARLGLSWLRPLWTRKVGLAVQGFALAGTLIGLLTIAVGAGPQTIPDILYHLGMVGLLSWGLFYTIRTPTRLSEEAEQSWPPHAA
jgi:hypothetical protein